MIRFLDPWWLLAVLPVLALAGAYVWRQLRRQAYAVRFTNVELLRHLAPRGLGSARRHVAAGAFLRGLLVLVDRAWPGPSVDTKEPLERATIMLAIDVSLSMQATDVQPTRIEAAKQAAKRLRAAAAAGVQRGAGRVREVGQRAGVADQGPGRGPRRRIDGLQLAEATATGEAVFASPGRDRAACPPTGPTGRRRPGSCCSPTATAPSGARSRRRRRRPRRRTCRSRRSRSAPTRASCEINGQTQRVPVDRPSLQQLAETTKGHFYEAATAEELKQVYQDMGSSIGYRTKPREIDAVVRRHRRCCSRCRRRR